MHSPKLEQFRTEQKARKPSIEEVQGLLRRLATAGLRPLRVLFLSDGRPGHYHLSEGIIAAMARCRAVETTRLEVGRSRLAPGRFLAALVNGGTSPAAVLRLGYGISAKKLPPADLVVSAGGDTLAANICAARIRGVPNVFYGSLRRFKPEDFALVFTSHARNGGRPRHVVTLKPSSFDPDELPPCAKVGGAAGFRAPRTAGLLVGGNTATIRYTTDDWTRLIGFMKALHAAHGTRWIVSNSRRTPQDATDRLARLAAEPGGPIAEFIDVRTPGAKSLGELFAGSDAIVSTVDSSSMVSEAVWVRRPLIAVSPASSTIPPAELEYRRYLEENGWARSAAIADLSVDGVLKALAEIKPLDANPLDLLAQTLFERLPGLLDGSSG